MTMLVVLLAALSAAGQSAAPTFKNFVGLWRINVDVSDNKNVSPTLLLAIRVTAEELTIERRDLAAGTTETSRYPLDGHSARTVRDGRPVDVTAAIEDAALVITSTLADRSTIKETFVVGRNTLMLERSITAAKTTATSEFYQRVPDNYSLHGGVELR